MAFMGKSRLMRMKSERHVHYKIPEKFYWDENVLKRAAEKAAEAAKNAEKSAEKTSEKPEKSETDSKSPKIESTNQKPENPKPEVKKEPESKPEVKPEVEPDEPEEEALEWLRAVEPYWTKFFGEFTLMESSSIKKGENWGKSWKRDLLNELSDDSMVILNNLALEMDLMELDSDTCSQVIDTYLTLGATRATQNEVPRAIDRPVEPVSTHKLVLHFQYNLANE